MDTVDVNANVTVNSNTVTTTPQQVSLDEMLTLVGSFGKFQKFINIVFCIMTIPAIYHVMITYFTADTPSWRCHSNSSLCVYNSTMSGENRLRCHIPRKEWYYTEPKDYSIVTQWGIDCDKEWLKELVTSIFFFGWLIGAPTLGWIADNYGRRFVLIHSMNIVLAIGLVSAFVPNVYIFIVCRFLIGFFVTGTFQQMFLIITEIVGNEHRTFSGIILYTFAAVSLTIVGIQSYFIRQWKMLYIITSAPFSVLVFSYAIIPKSVCFVHMKGDVKELMTIFQRLAKWNGKTIPPGTTIAPPVVSKESIDPFDLFRNKTLLYIILIQTVALFTNVATYYGLYLAAGQLGGSLYLDFIVVTVIEIPLSLLSIYGSSKYGRKMTTLSLVFLSLVACIGLTFTPHSDTYKHARVALGMMGKGCCGAAFITLTSWGTDLFPTKFKAEAVGVLQIFTRLGSICAPWMDVEFAKIYVNLSYIFMCLFSLASFVALVFLPEVNEELVFSNGYEQREIELTDTQTDMVVQAHTNDFFAVDLEDGVKEAAK